MSSPTRRVRNILTDKAVRAHKAGELADGGGLYVVVRSDRKRFVHKYQWDRKTRERWLPGTYPDEISLSEARDIRDADRKLLREGVNPIQAARARFGKGVTFAEYAKAHVAFLAPPNANGRQAWLRQMTGQDSDGVTAGALATMPIDDIRLEHVKAIIAPIWATKPATAKEVCGRIRRVIDHRMVNHHPDDDRQNPADFKRIERAIGKRFEQHTKSRASLPYEQVPAFLARLAERPQLSARALEVIIAAGSRVKEITHARWNEIDWKARTLTIPAARMKTQDDVHGEAHVIPLSLMMVRALRRAVPPHGYRPTDLIFPNSVGRPFASKDVLAHVKALAGETPTTHGFRSTLMNWGTAISHRAHPAFDRDLMDTVLAHALGDDVSQAYLRDRWIGRRRVVMREWSRYLSQPAASNVVAFRRAA